jgi:hypothetical protein
MGEKNQMAEMAIMALRTFLAVRKQDKRFTEQERRAAEMALEVLKPFMAFAEPKIYAAYGSKCFKPQIFVGMLKSSVDEEWKRRLEQHEDLSEWVNADMLMKPFMAMLDELLEKIADQLQGS